MSNKLHITLHDVPLLVKWGEGKPGSVRFTSKTEETPIHEGTVFRLHCYFYQIVALRHTGTMCGMHYWKGLLKVVKQEELAEAVPVAQEGNPSHN